MSQKEIWVCRVVLRPGPDNSPYRITDLSLGAHQNVMAKVISGDLGVTQDGFIIEPLSSHPNDADALAQMTECAKADPSREYRVVHTIEVPS